MPHGFICGFPLGDKRQSSELWGFVGGMRPQGVQGEAIVKAMTKWGGGRRSEMVLAVCKTGFQPYVHGRRMFGCKKHSDVRQRLIEDNGGYLRPGWEPFDQFPAPEGPSTVSLTEGSAYGADDDGEETTCAIGLSACASVSAFACGSETKGEALSDVAEESGDWAAGEGGEGRETSS